MKTIFPLLLCYVLMTAQTFALSGGPIFGGAGSVTGTYSGTLQGTTDTDKTGVKNKTSKSTALGIFSLSIPSTANATGSFLLFANGSVFTGTITGSAAPTGTLQAIVQASRTFSVTRFTIAKDGTISTATTQVTASANGKLAAQINTGTNSKSGGNMQGTATLDVNFGEVDNDNNTIVTDISRFNVTGFRQSTTASSTTGTATSTGTGGSGSL